MDMQHNQEQLKKIVNNIKSIIFTPYKKIEIHKKLIGWNGKVEDFLKELGHLGTAIHTLQKEVSTRDTNNPFTKKCIQLNTPTNECLID